jgi:hypothetical protein
MVPERNGFYLVAQNIGATLPTDPFLKGALLRTAISRLYFALYNEAFNALPITQRRSLPGGANNHQAVENIYSNDSNPAKNEVGEALDGLRSLRNQADYNKGIDNLEFKTRLAYEAVKSALEKL